MEVGHPWEPERLAKVRRLVIELFQIVRQLESEFAQEGRKFTLDGHLVGSLGEVIAAYCFDLQLLRSSNSTHDAKSRDGKMVQIKLTGGRRVALYSKPEFLIVLRLMEAKITVVYNGPGDTAWKCCGKPQKNGQQSISVRKLMELDENALPKIRQVRDFPL